MEQTHYLISDAAKQVEVESHVLRYWEEELGIPIKRNELGHRYYTREDVDRFREIKGMKEQGLQLKAIKMILKNGHLERYTEIKTEEPKEKPMIEIIGRRELEEKEKASDRERPAELGEAFPESPRHYDNKELSADRKESKEEKGIRLQLLLQHMISEAVRENNKELCENIKECILKEMDYQFRQQEEKEEERELERRNREDAHYQKVDEMLRSCSKKGWKKEKEKKGEKQSRFGVKKRPSIV